MADHRLSFIIESFFSKQDVLSREARIHRARTQLGLSPSSIARKAVEAQYEEDLLMKSSSRISNEFVEHLQLDSKDAEATHQPSSGSQHQMEE